MTQVIDFIGGEYENRTHVHGFAIRCVTTPPTRRKVWVRSRPWAGGRQGVVSCLLRQDCAALLQRLAAIGVWWALGRCGFWETVARRGTKLD